MQDDDDRMVLDFGLRQLRNVAAQLQGVLDLIADESLSESDEWMFTAGWATSQIAVSLTSITGQLLGLYPEQFPAGLMEGRLTGLDDISAGARPLMVKTLDVATDLIAVYEGLYRTVLGEDAPGEDDDEALRRWLAAS
jgi:hypothetical protein